MSRTESEVRSTLRVSGSHGENQHNAFAIRIRKLEDIRARQEAGKLVQQVYTLTRTGAFARDDGLRDQIQRASVSVMANIAEGFDRDSKIEFAGFLSYSRRSAGEAQSLTCIAYEVGYISKNDFDEVYEKTRVAKSLVSALKASIRKWTIPAPATTRPSTRHPR